MGAIIFDPRQYLKTSLNRFCFKSDFNNCFVNLKTIVHLIVHLCLGKINNVLNVVLKRKNFAFKSRLFRLLCLKIK